MASWTQSGASSTTGGPTCAHSDGGIVLFQFDRPLMRKASETWFAKFDATLPDSIPLTPEGSGVGRQAVRDGLIRQCICGGRLRNTNQMRSFAC